MPKLEIAGRKVGPELAPLVVAEIGVLRGGHPRLARDFRGPGRKQGPVGEEAPPITFAYPCVVTIKPVQAAETFMRDNIWMKRPGAGELLAERFEDVIEKVASHDLPADLQPKVAYVSGLEPPA